MRSNASSSISSASRSIFSTSRSISHMLHFYISVEEFDEEEGDVIHHQHRLLSCLDLATEGQYSIFHEDKSIYSDPEEDFMPRAWPDVTLPQTSLSTRGIP